MIELLLEAESALSLGLLDRAEILYRQVAAADPRNAIAVVGLARVTLERGDEVAALKLARRALAIDPENVSAQRMTQRLEEVLRYRGAEVPPDTAQPAAPPRSAGTLGSAGTPVGEESAVGAASTTRSPVPAPPMPNEAPRASSEPPGEASSEPPRDAPDPGSGAGAESRSIIDRLLRRRP